MPRHRHSTTPIPPFPPRMAEVMASISDTMHHDPSLRPSVRARHGSDARDLLSGVHVVPFHERTPIHTMPQDAMLSSD